MEGTEHHPVKVSLEEDDERSCQLDGIGNQPRISASQTLDFSSEHAASISDLYSSEVRQIPRLSSTLSHRNGFSMSMGDLSGKSNGCRKSVIFDEDLFAHKEMLQRARNRFRELELKYPEILRNSSRTSSLSCSAKSKQSESFDCFFSLEAQSLECQHTQTSNRDALQVPRKGILDPKSNESAVSKRRPPPLSIAMKLHNLESSCDSAFDEMDHESLYSRTSHEPTPTSQCSNHFLYPGDSIESDKDSGISTDRPFTPSSKPSKPVRWADPTFDDLKSVATKSKSLPLLSSRTNSQEIPGSEADNKNRRIDRRGILKSVAYRNQEIKTESLDVPSSTTNSIANLDYCHGRQHRGGSLSANSRRGTSIYRRSLFGASSSQDDTDSEAETVCSVQSEFILRPHMSARERYFSTYQLNTISEAFPNTRVYKWRSMPEIGRGSLGSIEASSFCGDTLPAGFEEKKKKKLKKFGRRSGLYVVNDNPVSEKPRLSIDKGKSRTKIFNKKSKKTGGSVHINELTKTWFDNRTAVSQPTGGKSLGRIVVIREDLGTAYQLELQRSPGGLFGFFIQKGFKQYKSGVFVSRIMDCSSSKFMAGLLNPGDEILEINGEKTSRKSMAEVHNILANSDKLLLTVLPLLGRKDW